MRRFVASTIVLTLSACIANTAVPLDAGHGDYGGHGDETPPAGTPELMFTTTYNGEDRLEWTRPDDAFRFDLVRGDLTLLIQTQGDFTQATTVCLADDTFQTEFEDADEPSVGGGFWYVVRGDNYDGNGTYDSLSASQVGSRDAEINASTFACP